MDETTETTETTEATELLLKQLNCALQAKRLHLQIKDLESCDLCRYTVRPFPDEVFSHSFYLGVDENNDLSARGVKKVCVSVTSYEPESDSVNIELSFFDDNDVIINDEDLRLQKYTTLEDVLYELSKLQMFSESFDNA